MYSEYISYIYRQQIYLKSLCLRSEESTKILTPTSKSNRILLLKRLYISLFIGPTGYDNKKLLINYQL